MTTTRIEFEIPKNIQEVWKAVTDVSEYTWRSDIVDIRKIDDSSFVEVSKDHIETTFTITDFEIEKRYAFDIQNKNMSGHWIGLFEPTSQGTKLIMEESVEVKHAIMKLFIKKFLKQQQATYVKDLRKRLED